ncbi:GTP 3',8-cyclase MoaA [Komagataeibacter medellinensis]|uniref:GTP 3',8-cyclase n=1 Tax=Komagataeibacter medellinensis (strain NBRC 3288 / BCRC 11682 / LMG 1693 / Kondo 51) TaxID=634177 RepID=G2I2C9_KOMMN|nr:GTP 3',8-cyclase MoaA [Komagataeibacter medellinensis]BAK82545.1 molybdenum cofactor biosynthesis protein A [Komagataeibacter medellinensis NBRC 3288]
MDADNNSRLGSPVPPVDRLGRPLRDLRISVMDRCNFRCPYCMPEATYHEAFRFLGPEERLDFNEIERVARVAAELGVTKIRLTGGEPLLRPGLPDLVSQLRVLPGIEDIALTTNGVLLPRFAPALLQAGLRRVTVSLDSLDPVVFAHMSGGRSDLSTVMEGINAAGAAGFEGGVKINTVVQRGVNDAGVPDILARFRNTGITVRLIEYMDVGNRNGWDRTDVVPSDELRARITALWPLEPLPPRYRGEVARRYRYVDGAGEIGFVSSVSAPFCGACSRARLSSDGKLYTCLFATTGTDLRGLLRQNVCNVKIDECLRTTLSRIWYHRTDRYSEERTHRPALWADRKKTFPQEKIEMHYIGG